MEQLNISIKTYKWYCEIFWKTKGHLGVSSNTIISAYDGYFRRLWDNVEAGYPDRLNGFEEAWQKHISEKKFKLNEKSC